MTSAPRPLSESLPSVDAALVVIAHPDDESFGLGAVLHALVTSGTRVDVLCFTHGEASTLGAVPGLGELRKAELLAAGAKLGVGRITLLARPDGLLDQQAEYELDADVEAAVHDAKLVVVFEPEGVTGHPDHRAATAAGLRAAGRRSLPVLEWGIHPDVARALRCEFAAPFVALDGPDTIDVLVDRTAQYSAIACHESQAHDNPVLRRRLQLQGERERLRYSRPA